MVLPDAAPCSSLPLNGHSVNPLKVYSPAAVRRQDQGQKVARMDRGKEWGNQKRKQQEVIRKNAAEQCCSHHASSKQLVKVSFVRG